VSETVEKVLSRVPLEAMPTRYAMRPDRQPGANTWLELRHWPMRVTSAAHLNGAGTGVAANPSTRWEYTLQPLRKTGDVEATGCGFASWGDSVTAYNIAEIDNPDAASAGDPLGCGPTLAELDINGDDSWEFYPVPVTGVVMAWQVQSVANDGTVTTEWWFDRPNGISGACEVPT
jgi:hypothetical protein